MIMVPAEKLYRQQAEENYGGYGGWGDSYSKGTFDLMSLIGGYDYSNQLCLGSDLLSIHQMAEDGSRTNSFNEEEAGSNSKDLVQQDNKDERWLPQDNKDERWLQLGLGNYGTGSELKHHNSGIESTTRRSELVELDLLPKPSIPIFHTTNFRSPSPRSSFDHSISTTPNLYLQHARTSFNFPHHSHEISWGYRPSNALWNPTAGSSSSSVPFGSFISRSYQHPSIDIGASSSSDYMRVVDAPPRPHSGIWFLLQASRNQGKEPFLPQVPKSYLRIKDERMTVRLLMKYLANKLRLNSESEVEITCRGQQLQPLLSLQHVRDNIWSLSSREIVTLLPDSSTTDHVMILHYGRRTTV